GRRSQSRSAREMGYGYRAEHVKLRPISQNSVCDDLSHVGCKNDSFAGIPASVDQTGLDLSHVRHPVGSNRQGASPRIIELDGRELRKQPRNMFSNISANVARKPIAVILAPSEQQAMIRGDAK